MSDVTAAARAQQTYVDSAEYYGQYAEGGEYGAAATAEEEQMYFEDGASYYTDYGDAAMPDMMGATAQAAGVQSAAAPHYEQQPAYYQPAAAPAPERRPLQPQTAQAHPVAQPPAPMKPSAAVVPVPAPMRAAPKSASAHFSSTAFRGVTYHCQLPLIFKGRQGGLDDHSVNRASITAATLRTALKRGQQLRLPSERAFGNVDGLDIKHCFVFKVKLRQLHNTFHQSFAVVCVNNESFNGQITENLAYCFYAGESMEVQYPKLCLLDKEHHLQDPLFQSVAGNSVNRLMLDPAYKTDERLPPGMIYLMAESPLTETIYSPTNIPELQREVPSWNPNDRTTVILGNGYAYVTLPSAVVAQAIKLYKKVHKSLVDIIDFNAGPLTFQLMPIDGQGSLTTKGQSVLDPDHVGQVVASLDVTMIFPPSSVNVLSSATKVSKAKRSQMKATVQKQIAEAINS